MNYEFKTYQKVHNEQNTWDAACDRFRWLFKEFGDKQFAKSWKEFIAKYPDGHDEKITVTRIKTGEDNKALDGAEKGIIEL